jgi:ferric-dicitrate binding protein FerR (iron transport regulator)
MPIAGSRGPGAAAAWGRHDRVAQEAWMRVLAVGARPDDIELGRAGAHPPAPTPARPSHRPPHRAAGPTAAIGGLR